MPGVTGGCWPTREWQSAEPGTLGLRPDGLLELDRAITAQYGSILGIVIVRHGCLAYERYNHGFGPEHAHPVASVTKSFISALIGIAIDLGYIQDVDQKVLDFFPEYVSAPGDYQKRLVTLRRLLTMTAPFAWKAGPRGHEPLDRLRRQPDWTAFILDLLGRGGQVGRFQYSSLGPHLLSVIIARSTGMCAREFANLRLFGPLGMQQVPDREMKTFSGEEVFGGQADGWARDPQGHTIGGWGLCLTPRDMARFGSLYLNRGAWDGAQIVSGAWVDASTAPNANGYGYLWWVKGEAYAASGYGGNHIFCLPRADLVVAIASRPTARPRDRWLLLNQSILPVIE